MKNRTYIPQAIACVLLFVALIPSNPYAYYVFLRWVVCPIFAFLAVRAIEIERTHWAWVFGVSAALYNPILRVHLNREIWSVVNVASIILCIWAVFALKRKGGSGNE